MMRLLPCLSAAIFIVVSLMPVLCFGAASAKITFVQSVYDGPGGLGLRYPEGVACTDEHLVVADTGNNRLLKYPFQENIVVDAEFEVEVAMPTVAQLNSKGEIYVLDQRDRRILILNPDGSEKEYVSPKKSPVARKMVPKSFAIDDKDNIYVLDVSEGLVLVLDPGANYLRHITFPEEYGFFSDLTVDKQGTVYLVDSIRAEIYQATTDDDTFTILSSGLREFVNFPTNIASNEQGVLFLVDKHGGSLALVSRDGSFLGHKFGYGWRDSQFYYPAQMCISPGGFIFVADRSNSRVQMFRAED